MRFSPFGTLLTLCLITLPVIAVAQGPCTLEFAPGDPVAGVDGPITALLPWDPDGAGLLPMHVVATGSFEVAGGVVSPNIAAYEPVSGQWLAFGQGLPGLVRGITKRANGNLIVASDAGGVFEWNGTAWQQLGGNFVFPPNTVAVLPNGDVVAGGAFLSIGGVPIHGIARWDGTTWHAMGAPLTPWIAGVIYKLAMLPSGDLVAMGLFTQIGGVACSYIARWDGTAWNRFGNGSATVPQSMTVTTTGDLVVSGTFATSTGTARFARWSAGVWVDVGAGLPMNYGQLSPLPNGELLAVGPAGIWSSNASGWSQYAPWTAGIPFIDAALALSSTDVLVGGYFEPSAIVPSRNFARWQGSTWQATSAGNDNTVTAVVERPDGSFVVGGHFSTIGGVPANRLAHYDQGTWTAIASTAIGPIRHAIARPDGEVVLVGEFPNQTTGGMDFVMRWNGGQVTPLYGGLWGAKVVESVALAKNGDVMFGYTDFAALGAGLARWDGATLTSTPAAGIRISALLELPNGDWLIASGLNDLQRWNGTTLSAFAPTLNGPIYQLGQLPNGDILASGAFLALGQIARWDGVAWQTLGAGLSDNFNSFAVLPNGDVIVCERRSHLQGWASRVRRWQGTTWTTIADTVGQADVMWSNAGAVVLYGEFTKAGGAANAYLARLEPTCAANVQDLGGGCIGAAGPIQLTASDRAWIGATLHTDTSGLPTGALSIGVFGSSATAQPLSSLHPLGTPGCNLLVTDDILVQFDVSGGAASAEIFVPNAPALVGAQFHHQLLAVEVGATGNLAAITSSNALLLTIGAL
ncbi:MAG: hypothetical protein ACI89X_000979 [Planctomycetota bacterium]|jgi:hypothetical protein